MPFTGTPFYPRADNAGNDSGTKKIESAGVANGTIGTQSVAFSTDTTDRWICVKPGLSNSAASTSTNPAGRAAPITGQFGWQVLTTDMDAVSSTPASRIVAAGTVVALTLYLTSSALDAAYANQNIVVNYYKRTSSTPTFTFLDTATSASGSPSLAIAAKTASVTLAADWVFAAGETLHVEVWVRGRGIAVTGQTVTITTGNPTGVPDPGADATLALGSGVGLRYRYPRTVASTVPLVGARGAFAVGKVLASTVLLAGAVNRALVKAAIVASATLVGGFARRLTLARSAIATVPLVATRQPLLVLLRSFATLTTLVAARGSWVIGKVVVSTIALGATMTRLLSKNFVAAVVMVPGYARALQFARSFASGVALVARGAVQLPFDVLARMSGAATVIKKIITIFDD
jgi:hypothetical protein